MFLIVGLGNPGQEYKNTRHNAGFMFIDELAKNGFVLQSKPNIDVFKGTIDNKSVMLLKPQAYMNNSGIPVSSIVNFYKINPNNIFVFYDDIDIKLGKVKYKIGGGDGGHNGIKSLNANIGKNYNRIRIGVDRPKNNQDVSDYVLGNFNVSEIIEIEIIIKNLVDNINNIITGNI